MKRAFTYFSLAIFVIVALTSCDSKNEIYDPDCRIYKIWFNSNVADADQIFTYEKKNIVRIDVKDSTYYTFEYNKDNTVSGIFHSAENYDESIQITYLNKLAHKIIYSMDGATRHEITFEREDPETNRISKITEIYDKEYFDSFELHSKSALYRSFIGDPEEIQEILKNNDVKTFSLKCTTTVVYDDSELGNILSTHSYYSDVNQEITTEYQYDTGLNPYFGLSFAYNDLWGYSANNKVFEVTTTLTNGLLSRYIEKTYSYQYNDKNYPREFTTTSSENNIPRKTYVLYVKE